MSYVGLVTKHTNYVYISTEVNRPFGSCPRVSNPFLGFTQVGLGTTGRGVEMGEIQTV